MLGKLYLWSPWRGWMGLEFPWSPSLNQALKLTDQNAWFLSAILGRMVRQLLVDIICSLIYIDSYTYIFIYTDFPGIHIFSTPLRQIYCDSLDIHFPLLLTWKVLISLQAKKRERKRKQKRKYKPPIFSSFLLLGETIYHNYVQWKIKRDLIDWEGFAFLIQMSPYRPSGPFSFLKLTCGGWNLSNITRLGC